MSAKFDASVGGTLLFRVKDKTSKGNVSKTAQRSLKRRALGRAMARPAARGHRAPAKPPAQAQATRRPSRAASKRTVAGAMDRFVTRYFECLF